MVTGCEVEPCKESGKPGKAPPELLAVLDEARKKVTGGKKWKPIPVSELVSSNAIMRDLIIIIGDGCIYICIFNFCILCCLQPRHIASSRISSSPCPTSAADRREFSRAIELPRKAGSRRAVSRGQYGDIVARGGACLRPAIVKTADCLCESLAWT